MVKGAFMSRTALSALALMAQPQVKTINALQIAPSMRGAANKAANIAQISKTLKSYDAFKRQWFDADTVQALFAKEQHQYKSMLFVGSAPISKHRWLMEAAGADHVWLVAVELTKDKKEVICKHFDYGSTHEGRVLNGAMDDVTYPQKKGLFQPLGFSCSSIADLEEDLKQLNYKCKECGKQGPYSSGEQYKLASWNCTTFVEHLLYQSNNYGYVKKFLDAKAVYSNWTWMDLLQLVG